MKNMTEFEWKNYLSEGFEESVNGILEQGKRMYQYWQSCENVSGGSVFARNVGEWFGMSAPTASRWVQIGRHHDELFHRVKKLPLSHVVIADYCAIKDDSKRKAFKITPKTTKADVKEYKIEIGQITAPAKQPKPKKDEKIEITERIAMLIPPTMLAGLSDFGRRALYENRKKIEPLLDECNKALGTKALKAFVTLLEYHKKIFDAMVRKEVKAEMKKHERISELDAWEKRLQAREEKLAVRSVRLREQISDKDIKLIQGCLHPDKIPNGSDVSKKRYARAFDAFRRAL